MLWWFNNWPFLNCDESQDVFCHTCLTAFKLHRMKFSNNTANAFTGNTCWPLSWCFSTQTSLLSPLRDQLATHGLSCRLTQGRRHKRAALKSIVHRALSSANIPSRLEPSGLSRTDGKQPDGLLHWDTTCPDTYAPLYITTSYRDAEAVAAQAEVRKESTSPHASHLLLWLWKLQGFPALRHRHL